MKGEKKMGWGTTWKKNNPLVPRSEFCVFLAENFQEPCWFRLGGVRYQKEK
jgi:hypothetical protein